MDESRAEVAADPALATRFTQLLERHEAQLHAFVGGIVADRELARDIVQDTFVAAWRATSRHQAPFEDQADEQGTRRWLYAVAHRQALLSLRRRRRFVWQSLEHDGLEYEPESVPDPASDVVEADALRAALRALDPVDAACFLLQVIQGFSTQEIGDIVHLRPIVVRKRLSRARRRLRDAYIAQGALAQNLTL